MLERFESTLMPEYAVRVQTRQNVATASPAKATVGEKTLSSKAAKTAARLSIRYDRAHVVKCISMYEKHLQQSSSAASHAGLGSRVGDLNSCDLD